MIQHVISYGWYVWPAYSIAFAVIGYQVCRVWYGRRAVRAFLKARQAAERAHS